MLPGLSGGPVWHFIHCDRRAACANLVVFLTNLGQDNALAVRETRPVDWSSWRKK